MAAREAYDTAFDALDEASTLASEQDFTSTRHETLLSKVDERITDSHRSQLREELSTVFTRIEESEEALRAERITEAIDQFEAVESELDRLAEKASEHGFDNLQSEVRALQERCEDGLAAVDCRRTAARHQELNTTIDDIEQDLDTVVTGIETDEPTTLRDQLDEIADQLDGIEADQEAPNEELAARIATLRDRLDEQHDRIDAAVSLQKDIEAVRDRLDQAEDKTQEGAYEDAIDRYEDIGEELDSLSDQAASQNLPRLSEQIETLQERLEEGLQSARDDQERAAVRAELKADIEAHEERLAQAEAALDENRFDDAINQFENLEGDVAALAERADAENFEGLLEEVSALGSRREEGLATARERRRQHAIDDLTARLSTLETALDSIEADLDTVTPSTLRGRLDDLAGDLEAASERANTLEAADLQQQITTLEDRLASLRDDVETVADLQSNLDEVRERVCDAESTLEDGDAATAIDAFDTVEPQIEKLVEQANEERFTDLSGEAEALLERCQEGRERVEKRKRPGPPASIPDAPSVSVNYDDLERIDLLGKGGNADVYLMKTSEDVELAVKEPRFSGTLHTETVKRFLAEAETWDQLDDHDHIVEVVDYGENPLPWIAMEYMDGDDLGDRIDDVDLREAAWIALVISEGVLHAHRRGVAHLDLKPANILFRETEGEDWPVPKIADWGLAKMLLEHSKSIEGLTPQYAAPEQLDEESGSADQATDVYQLGAVMYELFTGRPPFTGSTIQIVQKIANDPITPPTEVNPELPEKIDEVLLTALAKEKDDRYEHLIYLRDGLRDIYEDL